MLTGFDVIFDLTTAILLKMSHQVIFQSNDHLYSQETDKRGEECFQVAKGDFWNILLPINIFY